MSSISQYKVGVGVTTFNRPAMLDKCLSHIHKYSESHQLYVAVDKDDDRQGVAKRKNECLRALKDCDYIFLYDDDTYPIAKGWEQHFIESKYHHLLYLNNTHNYFKSINSNAKVYHDCGGVFMFMTKEVIETVGGFNEEFDTFGFEHAEYSQRVYKAGLTVAPYICLNDTNKYIYSHDYSDPLHKSSISVEERNKFVKKNYPKFFNQPINNIYLPI